MKSRCLNPNTPEFHRYGGRGISICERWIVGEDGNHPFECFLADMGQRPSPAHSIDRIDNDRGYEPSNCRWATWTTQSRNTSANHLVELDGSLVPLTDAAEAATVKYNTVLYRLKRGWTVPDAVHLAPRRGRKP